MVAILLVAVLISFATVIVQELIKEKPKNNNKNQSV